MADVITDIALNASKLSETSPSGTTVGALSATTSGSGAFTYSIVNDPDNKFNIVTEAGINKLTIKAPLDSKVKASHSVDIKVADANGNSHTETFTVAVQERSTITIDASSLGGIDFSTWVASYYNQLAKTNGAVTSGNSAYHGGTQDGQFGYYNGDQVTFRFKTTASGSFTNVVSIDGDDLAYDSIHYQSQFPAANGYISGTVNSITFGTLNGTAPASGPILFTNYNPLLKISGFDITTAPGAGGTSASSNPVPALYYSLQKGQVATIDGVLDRFNQKFLGSAGSDTFTGGDFDDVMKTNGGSDVFNGGAGKDIVELAGAVASWTFTKVSDGNWTASNGTDTVTLTNVEYAKLDDKRFNFTTGTVIGLSDPPESIALTAATVAENAPADTLVGALSATDPEGDAITWSLGNSSAAGFAIVGSELRTTAPLDFEAGATRSVTVIATDANGEKAEKTFTIDVTNVEEAPQSVSLSKTTVSESSKAGAAVGTLSALDPEGTPISWALTGSANGLFQLSGNEIRVVGTLDYEKLQSATITVEAKDGAGLATSQEITIAIRDEWESLTGDSKPNTLEGGIGKDVIKGGGGNDTLLGGGGRDSLYGEGGGDTLKGGAERDYLRGGAGADKLYGGDGDDRFIFRFASDSRPETRDTIFDFDASEGDKIDLSSFDANGSGKGKPGFEFIGTDAFSGAAGELRTYKGHSNSYLLGDTDGDGNANFIIHFDDALKIVRDDLIL